MEQNYSSTKLPTAASTQDTGHTTPGAVWANPTRIVADDGSSATFNAYLPGQSSSLTGSSFGFQKLPPSAVIDGIQVYVEGSQVGCFTSVGLNISGSTPKDGGALGLVYGGPKDKWGKTSITIAEIAALAAYVDAGDVSGGDGYASVDHMTVTVFWHIAQAQVFDADVPTRFDYKMYSSAARFLGNLPNVTSKFGPAQDINSAGSSIEVICGKYVNNPVTAVPLQAEDGNTLETESGLPITVAQSEITVARGNSKDDAIFKNGNRLKVWMYNKYYPNGKLMFSGQVNRVKFRYGATDKAVKLTVFSDGVDMVQYIARGYPFAYTPDQTQNSYNTVLNAFFEGGKGSGWTTYGQTWTTGAGVNNLASLALMLQGTADVLLGIYDAPNGNLIGSATKSISNGTPAEVLFEFAQLIPVTPNTQYFFALWLSPGQNVNVYMQFPGNVYVGGSGYQSDYSGGSGGGAFATNGDASADLYFKTASGLPTTTATYTSQDPVTGMGSKILLDYNARGGYIKEGDFDASGLSLTYTFVVANIYSAFQKIVEMIQTGYYMYIDLGTAEMDLKQMSQTADFTVVRGRDFSQLDIDLSIEQVQNYLLLTGGEVSPGVNAYRDYQDAESSTNYGLRTATKSDNRMTQTATMDAVGQSFIEENSQETQETQLIVLNSMMDITLLKPGKTIGFRNFDSFVDEIVVPIVRREPNYNAGVVVLTLGRLPVRQSDEIQRLNRELLFEQTINNPTAPS
jgi:hypothetical protein